MKLAAQYLRMSTDHQRYSLSNQAALIAEFAASEGYEIVRSYEDAGKSGVTTSGRTGLKALLRDVLGGASFSTILVVDVSRWGRYQDPDEAAHYEFLCRGAGVRVRYCAEPFEDDGSPTSALVKSIKRVMAAEYSKQLSDRVRAALRRKMMAGSKCGGNPPYGFSRRILNADGTFGAMLEVGERRSREDQSVCIVHGPQDEINVLRRIFWLFVRDFRGVTEIANMLNAKSIPYRRPGPWDEGRVRAVLKNELAIGVFAFNRTTSIFGEISKNKSSEWIRVRITDPLVSRSIFDAAQRKLTLLKRRELSDDDMIGKLRRLLKKDGHLSRSQIDASPLVSNAQAYVRRFGTLDEAMRLAGFLRTKRYGNHICKVVHSAECIKQGLKRLLDEKGYLSAALIKETEYLPSETTICKRFGSLSEAYKAVGYNSSLNELVAAAWVRRREREKQASRQ